MDYKSWILKFINTVLFKTEYYGIFYISICYNIYSIRIVLIKKYVLKEIKPTA